MFSYVFIIVVVIHDMFEMGILRCVGLNLGGMWMDAKSEFG